MRIGVNDYFFKHNTKQSGNSYITHDHREMIRDVELFWDARVPGDGETTLDRKVVVPITDRRWLFNYKCALRARLVEGIPIQARVECRQAGEEPYVNKWVDFADAFNHRALVQTETKLARIVLYSAAALAETGEGRPGWYDWEIITLLCSGGEAEPMQPLTMARNYLEKTGGTKSIYTADEFAEAIWFHSTQKTLKVRQ